MNTKREIVKFLHELAIGVQGKRDNEKATIKKLKNEIRFKRQSVHAIMEKEKLLRDFELILEYTQGQLYEINYILSTISRDNRLKN